MGHREVNGRDKTLDYLRGFAMLQVIVVHVLYWAGFFSSPYINYAKSFCLFEMPVFFFVTGASTLHSRYVTYADFVQRRFLKMLIPYWVFAVICAFLSIAKYIFVDNQRDVAYLCKVFISWMIPINRQITSISYLTWALWFIPVYLCIVLFIPFMRYTKHKYELGAFLVVAFCATVIFDLGWIRYVFFYLIWVFAGLFYEKIKALSFDDNARKKLVLIAVILLIIQFGLKAYGYSLDMQRNKFPPNITFLIYSILIVSLIIYNLKMLACFFDKASQNRILEKMIRSFSTQSTTIFLYQVFAFNVTIRLSHLLIASDSVLASIAKAVLCFTITVPLCYMFSLIFGGIEKWPNIWLNKGKSNG